jgi:8-oxo-dGTP pyrophosphatase MutT (NUDIX family)
MRRSAGILLRIGNEILLCKRSDECKTLAGYWSIPGGGVEKGESNQRAAVREFLEETNILIDEPMIYVGTSSEETSSYKMDVFLVDIVKKIPVSLQNARDGFEHTECGYFRMDELPTPMPDGLKQIIKQL